MFTKSWAWNILFLLKINFITNKSIKTVKNAFCICYISFHEFVTRYTHTKTRAEVFLTSSAVKLRNNSILTTNNEIASCFQVLLCLNTVDTSIRVNTSASINILLWDIANRRMWRDRSRVWKTLSHVCSSTTVT